jgi:ActR/RegA family two-component response regulator
MILVIEDHSGWQGSLERALQATFQGANAVSWKLMSNASAARSQLTRERHHFISIDQNIPEKDGEIVLSESGLNLCTSVVEQNIVAPRVIYTAFGKVEYSNWAGRIGGVRYLEKGADDTKEDTYTAQKWAAFIKSELDNNYIPFALDLAGKCLPLSLAERARRAQAAYTAKIYETYMRLWLELWESALHLAFAQTLALYSHAKLPSGRPLNYTPDGTPAGQEQFIKEVWSRLAPADWMSPWARYISTGKKEGGSVGAGEGFLQGASIPLRKLRNDISHSFPGEQWEAWASEYREAVLFLIDALAFWIENPLLTRLQFHPTDRQVVVGQALMGDQLPFPTRTINVPTSELTRIPSGSTDHACLLWWRRGESESQVLDLDPFITLERDRQGRSHLLLLSHPARERGQWFYRSLTDGRLQSRPLTDSALQTVRSVFR